MVVPSKISKIAAKALAVFTVLFGCVFLNGCTTPTTQLVPRADWQKPSAGKATVRITRKDQATGSAVRMQIYDSGKEIGTIGTGGELCWERNPGGMLFAVQSDSMGERDICAFYIPDIQGGKRYAYHIYCELSGLEMCIREGGAKNAVRR